jgi:two-component system, OmpR family, sensor histidine kinase BaeS
MRSLAFKLTLAFLLVGLTGSILVAVITQQRTRAAFNQFILNRDQQVLVEGLLQYYHLNGSWTGARERLQAVVFASRDLSPFDGRRFIHRNWEHFTLIDLDRTIVFSSQSDKIGTQASNRDMDRAVRLVADGETVGWLLLAFPPFQWVPTSPEGLFLQNVNNAALLSAMIAVILALTLGSLLAFTMTRSLRELTEATVEIARGKLGRQVKVRSRDELGELASSFNKMSLDLAKATHARRQMTADIAHDLRSPLSVLSGYAEALSEGKLQGTAKVYDILYQETQHLSHLVEDLRTLSLADAGELTLNLQTIPPKTILERAVARHTVFARQKGISLKIDADKELPELTVDGDRMAQVFDNLITNAFRYTSSGGEITLAARSSNGNVRLQVRDDGSGIPPEELPYVFDRFFRGDPSRHKSGDSGLGLSIAKSIIESHGGKIEVESAPGNGAIFTITLAV